MVELLLTLSAIDKIPDNNDFDSIVALVPHARKGVWLIAFYYMYKHETNIITIQCIMY